jgi:hypothetical protein
MRIMFLYVRLLEFKFANIRFFFLFALKKLKKYTYEN